MAGAYLDRQGTRRRSLSCSILDDRGPNPDAYVGLMTHMIRASIPAERLRSLHIFVGDPEDFLARPPLPRRHRGPRPGLGAIPRALEPLLDQRPPAFVAAALNDHSWGRWIEAHPESRIGSDVAIVQGARVDALLDVPTLAIGPLPAQSGCCFGGGIAILYGLIGLGWTLALLGSRLRRFEALALAPAVGLAAIVLGGIVADRLGVRLIGVPGALVAIGSRCCLAWAALPLVAPAGSAAGSPDSSCLTAAAGSAGLGDRTDHHDPPGAGRHDLGKVLRRDPADREPRPLGVRRGVANVPEAGRRAVPASSASPIPGPAHR